MSKTKQFTIKNQTLFGSRAYQNFALGLFTFLAAYLVASLVAPVKNSSAETQEVSAHVMNTDTEISVTPGQETLTLNVGQPEATGTFLSGSDTLTVKSTASSGYQLYVSMGNNHTNGNRLYKDGDESAGFIAANHNSEGQTITYPSTATLAKNSWGFTTSEADNNNQVYGAIPLMGAEEQIASSDDATAAAGDSVPVYFAVNVDTNMVSGDYTGTVLYTIIAEADNADLGIPSINPQSASYNDIVTISVPLRAAIDSTEVLGTVTAKIGDQVCETTNIILGGATVNITCKVPQLTVANTYDVSVFIQHFDSTYVAENAFVYNAPTLANITTMQEMTSAICAATATGTKVTLKDVRGSGDAGSGNGNYGVVKAADGNCWMTDNLNLYNYTISSQTSDFDSPANYFIPASITATDQWNSNAYSPATDTSSANPKTGKKVEVAQGLGQYASSDTKYRGQVFYNWTVATAKEDTTSYTTTGPNTSICPKGWTLPTNGDKGVNKSWAKLLDTYGITTGTQLLANDTLGFSLYYGVWHGNYASETFQGVGSYLWSGTPSSETNVYRLNYNYEAVYPQDTGNKGIGLSIRCVAR